MTLDPSPPAWLKHDTAVSWGYKDFGAREAAWGSKTKHITRAFIEEISVLRLLDPGESLAKVLWVGERFGARMDVGLVNDGPVTISLET